MSFTISARLFVVSAAALVFLPKVGVRKRERIAYALAGGGLAIGLMSMIAVVTILP